MEFNYTFIMEEIEGMSEILYWADVTKVEFTVKGSVVNSIKGTHMKGKSDKDVQGLECLITNMRSMPRGLSKIFPNLIVLWLKCDLETITSEDLDGLENLKFLSLGANQIKSLPSNLLKNMKQLEWFDCDKNPLQYLGEKLLNYENAHLLKVVSFKGCECFDRDFPEDCSTLNELKDAIASTCIPPPMEVENFNKNLKIVGKFWHLWTTGNFSDFTIESGDEEFKVHKNILGMQSPVLAKAVLIDMEESKTNRMRIDDFTSDAVEEFLKYFYCGEISKVNAMEVFALAAKYDVPELQNIVEVILTENVDEENAFDVLKLGNLHESELIIKAAFEIIKTILSDIELVDGMMKKPQDLLELLEAKNNLDAEVEKYKKFIAEKNRE